jgi:hypothetical protein
VHAADRQQLHVQLVVQRLRRRVVLVGRLRLQLGQRLVVDQLRLTTQERRRTPP